MPESCTIVAVEVDLHQARGGDLVVGHAVGVDEEVAFLAGHARRDVVVDQIVHAVVVDQAVARREIDARLPTLRARHGLRMDGTCS